MKFFNPFSAKGQLMLLAEQNGWTIEESYNYGTTTVEVTKEGKSLYQESDKNYSFDLSTDNPYKKIIEKIAASQPTQKTVIYTPGENDVL